MISLSFNPFSAAYVFICDMFFDFHLLMLIPTSELSPLQEIYILPL